MGTTDDGLSPSKYRTLLLENFWEYGRREFSPIDKYFDRSSPTTARPPVFKKEHASRNVLLRNLAPEPTAEKVLRTIPDWKRHRWFCSMGSSQALAQSLFGNLIVCGKLECLRPLVGDDGKPLFVRDPTHGRTCQLEFEVDERLGEKDRGRTSVDVLFGGSYRVAVECKLGETEVGNCSRPRLQSGDPNYEAQHCDGSYTFQRKRDARCSLSSIGVKYWDYIPELFNWSAEVDHNPCPLNSTYQLVRNLLAVGVNQSETVSLDVGHAVLLYDDRNPAFQEGGKGRTAWNSVRAALKKPSLMQRCTWQDVVACLRDDVSLDWLATGLTEKYGF